MKINFLVLFFFISIYSFCQESKGPSNAEKILISDTIRKTLTNYFSDVKQSGLLAEFKYLDSLSDFFWVPPGYSSAINFDSVAHILRRNATLYKSIENRFDDLKIIVLSKRIVTYTARIHSKSFDYSGKTFEMDLIETGILIKRPSGWKLQCGQTSILR